MLGYRIGHKNYVAGLTASGIDGRWTSGGRAVIYCADSIPLAFLENLVRRQGVGFNSDFRIAVIDIPDKLKMELIPGDELAAGWREYRDYSICQAHGNKWYDEMNSPILKVPTSVLPSSCNCVINTNHTDFKKIKMISLTDLIPDEQIEDILKNYRVEK